MQSLADLIAELEPAATATLEQVDRAEDEIDQAQHRHPDKADLLYHALALLRPTADLMTTEFVYRGHCRELLDRLAAGGDTREATAAEVAIACSHASLAVNLGGAAVTVYMRAWAAAFPGTPAFEVLDLDSYEHVAGTAADELETHLRRRLRQPDRALAALECPGTHHGQPRPDCPYTTPHEEGTTMTITTACTSPLEEPRTRTGDRSYDYFWPLVRVDGDRYQGRGWAGVKLSVYHDRNGKRFWTSLHPTTVFDNGWTQTSVSLLTAPAWRKVQPVARYSAKAMDAFAAAALAEFRQAYTDGDEAVRTLFAEPS